MTTEAFRNRLKHALIPAVPVPFTLNRSIDFGSLERYAAYMNLQPVEGIAVSVHTGRGLKLTPQERGEVLQVWRKAMPAALIISGAGGNPKAETEKEYLGSVLEMGEQAQESGADALLAYAPVRYRQWENREDAVYRYHEKLGDIGLPVILFYLYEEAGGIAYSESLLHRLLELPHVAGIKIATLDSVVTFQNISQLLAQSFPNQVLITGEDRFLGYSLQLGAEAALIGMGSALTAMQKQLMEFYFHHDFGNFLRLSKVVDRFAQCTFCSPMEGYIGRLLYVLGRLKLVELESICDPWGPEPSEAELERIDLFLESLPSKYLR